MAIESVTLSPQMVPVKAPQAERQTPFESQQAFGTMLKEAIDNVNTAQQSSDTMTEKLISGADVDLHEVMITAQKASVTLSTAMEVRNKAIEAYQEIMRMPV